MGLVVQLRNAKETFSQIIPLKDYDLIKMPVNVSARNTKGVE